MPRLAKRRKAVGSDDNIAAEPNIIDNRSNRNGDEPKPKLKRLIYPLALPERPRVVGRALVCGIGDVGQLGLGADDSKMLCKKPELITQVTNVVDIVSGGMHNLVLTHDGRVFTFGCNDEGALGRNTNAEEGSEFEPRPTELPGRALKISAGDSHSACLLEDGRVYAWGAFRDSHGSMGLTLDGAKNVPFEILPGMTFCDIASGGDHLVMLTTMGKVYTVGCGEQGQLGRLSLRTAGGNSRRGKTDLLKPNQVIIRQAKPIEVIWATNYCTFLKESQTGAIWAFGLNNYNQLMHNQNVSSTCNVIPTRMVIANVKQIAGGQHHTLVLKTDGIVYVIGCAHYGRLGLGVLNEDVAVLTPIPALKDKFVVSVACGDFTSFALTQDGHLYAWGMGSNLQLGTGTEEDVFEPKLIVNEHTKGKRIIKVASGGQHSIFLVENELQPANVQKGDALTLYNNKNEMDEIIEENIEENMSSVNVNEQKGQKLKSKSKKDAKTKNNNANNNNNNNNNKEITNIADTASYQTPSIASSHPSKGMEPLPNQNGEEEIAQVKTASTVEETTVSTSDRVMQPPPAKKRGRKKKI